MKLGNCKTCGDVSLGVLDILNIHICTDCLDIIKNLDMRDEAYEYYRFVIGKAWVESGMNMIEYS